MGGGGTDAPSTARDALPAVSDTGEGGGAVELDPVLSHGLVGGLVGGGGGGGGGGHSHDSGGEYESGGSQGGRAPTREDAAPAPSSASGGDGSFDDRWEATPPGREAAPPLPWKTTREVLPGESTPIVKRRTPQEDRARNASTHVKVTPRAIPRC